MNNQTVASVAQEALKTPPKKRNLKLVHEEVKLSDGSTFVPMPVNNKSDILRASLLVLFKHVADIHYNVVEIIADKFGHTVEELHAAIVEDPRWQQMLVDPLVTDLTATAKENSVCDTKPKKKTIIKTSEEPELVFD
jgi:hypothetical protein